MDVCTYPHPLLPRALPPFFPAPLLSCGEKVVPGEMGGFFWPGRGDRARGLGCVDGWLGPMPMSKLSVRRRANQQRLLITSAHPHPHPHPHACCVRTCVCCALGNARRVCTSYEHHHACCCCCWPSLRVQPLVCLCIRAEPESAPDAHDPGVCEAKGKCSVRGLTGRGAVSWGWGAGVESWG